MSSEATAVSPGPIVHEIMQADGIGRGMTSFRSPRALAVAVTVVLGARLALSLGEAIGLVMRLRVLDDITARRLTAQGDIAAAARLGDSVVQLTAAGSTVALVAAYGLAGMWIYRAAVNVRALGARGLDVSPGWAVGFYAVPILSLFRPLQAMSEIWRASHSPRSWKGESAPPLLGFWWTGWIATNLGGGLVGAMARADANTIEGLTSLNRWVLGHVVVDAVAVALFLAVVWRITRAQAASRYMVEEVAKTFA
jgi:hypothetical protein